MKKTDKLLNPNSCMSRAEPDKMTFVLLGRDQASPQTIRYWCYERIRLSKNKLKDAQIQEALACADYMEQNRKAK